MYRTFDMFCDQRQSGTPLEKMRGARGAQKPSSHAFGLVGFVKPVLLGPWKGQKMVLCTYLGMRYVTGGGTCISSESRFKWSSSEPETGYSMM